MYGNNEVDKLEPFSVRDKLIVLAVGFEISIALFPVESSPANVHILLPPDVTA